METAKPQSNAQANVKKEPITPAKGNENGETGFTGGRGGGANSRGGSRGGRGGSNTDRGGLGGGRGGANAERGGYAGGRSGRNYGVGYNSVKDQGSFGNNHDSPGGGFQGGRGGGSGGGRGGGNAGNTGAGGASSGSGTASSPTPSSDRGGYGGRGSGERGSGGRGGAGGRGSYGGRGGERGGYGGRGGGSERGRGGRGRGYGRGGYADREKNPGGYFGMREMDRIAERLKALAGPMTDLPPREESEKRFSNHCRLWVGNLPLDINEDDVKELFKPFGEFDEVYFDKNKGFAFVRMDYKSNAEKARHDLHLKDYKGRQLKIRFSSPGTALKVRNISSWVTNELLEKAFSVFGDVEKAIVVTDERGKTAGEGIVEFCKKPAANLAFRKCQDGCFFLTSSPRPVVVEAMAITDDNEGMSEVNINKRNPEYIKERQLGPRFAHPGSFEYEYGLKWKQLYELFDKKKEALEKELGDEKKKLEEQIEYAKYEHETEMLRDQLRQREEMNQRNKQEFEVKQREWEEHKRLEEERQRTQEEELALKFRQQEEELRRRQEENRQFMQERAMSMMKQENYSNYNNSLDSSNSWRRGGGDNYQSEGGSSWRGGSGGASGGNWNRQNEMGTRSGSQTSWGSGGGGGGDSWNNRQDNWNQSETGRSNYQRSESDLPPPPDPHTFLENFSRGRNFDESSADYSHRNRDGVRSRWARSDRDDYGPAKRARY